ncbi:hypothetical protein KC349_g7348 [Hortaea werneckii]|nr:hypothetical protein KC349_g7348 [Hortaea werneckii]
MELTDFLLSLIKTLAIGIAIGLSVVATVLFILSLWKLGCILGQPVFVALLNSSPFRDTYTDDKDEKASSGTQDTPPTKRQQQQRPRLSASERKAKDARNFAGTLALFLCYVGASIEVTVATPPDTWQIPAGQDANVLYRKPTPKDFASESMDSFLTSLVRSLTSGLLAGFSIGAIGGFLILVWRAGTYVGRPLGSAIANAVITDQTKTENEGNTGPKATSSTSPQQQQSAVLSLEERRFRSAVMIAGIATAYLCIGFLLWEVAIVPPGTWDLAPGESAEKFLIPVCMIGFKTCLEAIVALGVLSGSVRVLGL